MLSSVLAALLIIPATWLAMLGTLFVLTFIVGLRERMMVWAFDPIDEASPARPRTSFDAADPYAPSAALNNPTPAPTGFAIRAADEAARHGFTHLGTFRDIRGGIYQIRYDVWLAPGGEALGVIAAGAVVRLTTEVTVLQTRLADRTRLSTIDQQRGSFVDLTGRIAEVLVPGASFADLLAVHRDRVRESARPVVPYPADPAAALAEYRALAAACVADLEARGLIAFVGPGRNAHRYTARGSFAMSWRLHARTYRRAFRPDRRPPQFPAAPGRPSSFEP